MGHHFELRRTGRCILVQYTATVLATLLAVLPSQAQNMQIPKPSAGLMPNLAQGKNLYAANCGACHGADLRGSDKGPSMLHKVYEPSHYADVAFQLAVKNGVRAHHWNFGDMKPIPTITPNEVSHITAFIRSEQRKAGIK